VEIKLKEFREKENLSLNKLRRILKEKYNITVSDSQLMYYENGTRKPRNNKVWESLADYFGVSVATLLGHDEISPEEMTTKLQDFFENLDMNELNNIKPNYDLLKKVQSAYENVEEHINNPKKYENFGKGLADFNQSYMLTIEKLIVNDIEMGTNFADILINYISLNDYDKKIAFDLVQKLSERDNEKE
jgi:hypothetical protein